MPAPVRIGVSGWTFPDWDRAVFPRPQPRGFHPLDFLARRIDAIEVTSTFHTVPRPELVRLWAAKVAANPEFRFSVRLHRDFSHERCLDAGRVRAFRDAIRPLAAEGRLGALLMQMPSAFRFTAENRDFLIELRRAFHEFPLVAELRHDSWAVEEAAGVLVDYHIGVANLDLPESLRSRRPASTLTSRIGYVKLHGRRTGPGFDDFSSSGQGATGNDYLYPLAELEAWQERIAYMSRFAEQVMVIFNNDAGGRSMVNALQMQSLLAAVQAAPRKTAARPANAPLFTPVRAA